MPTLNSNPYPVTSEGSAQPTRPVRWWKRILVLNVVLFGLYGVAGVAGYVALGGGSGSLSGIEIEGSLAQLWVEACLVIGIGFGLPNLFLILLSLISGRRN